MNKVWTELVGLGLFLFSLFPLIVEVEPLEVPSRHVNVRDTWLDAIALHVLHNLGGNLGQNVLKIQRGFIARIMQFCKF